MKKVTFTASRRIHATHDDMSTICGHIFSGDNRTITSNVCINKKNKHCKTCFVKKSDFESPWLSSKLSEKKCLNF